MLSISPFRSHATYTKMNGEKIMATGQQTCLVQAPDGKGGPVIHSRPIARLREGKPYDVLVRVLAVGLNPHDHKMLEHNPTPGAIMGCDFAGIVVAIGSGVGDLSLNIWPGSRVCGTVHGSDPANTDNGAFATFLVADARLLLRVPIGWSDLEAAALGGIGWLTVGLATGDDSLRLPGRPSAPAQPRSDGGKIPVLVYGAATATGTVACQLLARYVKCQY